MSNASNDPKGEQAPNTGEKTFTQDDVNRIVGERLAEDRKKAGAELEQREKDLQRRELTMKAKEGLMEKKLPAELLDLVNLNDEENMNKSLETIGKHYQPQRPNINGVQPVDGDGIAPGSGCNPANTYYGRSDNDIRRAMRLD